MTTVFNANVDGDTYTPLLIPQGVNNTLRGAYHANGGGGTEDLEATLILQVYHGNDPKVPRYNDIGWLTEGTHSFNTAIAGSEVSDEFNFANCPKNSRIKIDMTGGTDGQVHIEIETDQ